MASLMPGADCDSSVPFSVQLTDTCVVHASVGGQMVAVENFSDELCTCKWSLIVHHMIQSQFILQDLGASVCPQVVKAKAVPKEKVTPEKSKPKTKKEKAEAAKIKKSGGIPEPTGIPNTKSAVRQA